METEPEMRVIAGIARSIPLKTVPGMDTRPTTDRIKETLFNILQPELADCRFLDLFAGSGAIGIEALSRGAACAVFVEKSPAAARCIRENLEKTKLAQDARLVQQDVLQALAGLHREAPFDIVFMDPPYNMDWERKVLEVLAKEPYITENTLIIAEVSLETDLSYVEDLGFEIRRRKDYKTNSHIFIGRK